MNVGDLKDTIAAYLQVPVDDTVVNGIDLCMFALNNAKKYAERFHDWNCEEVVASGTAVEGKGSWASMTVEGDIVIKLKQPQTFYWQNDEGELFPLYHHSKKHGAVWAKERLEARGFDREARYRGDTSFLSAQSNVTGRYQYRYEVFVFGKNYELQPKPEGNVTVVVDGYRWLDEYSSNDDEDFFTEHGHDFLMHAGIVELNMLFQTFIPQQEGNLAPPERARDDALASLIEYDNFLVESGRQPQRS